MSHQEVVKLIKCEFERRLVPPSACKTWLSLFWPFPSPSKFGLFLVLPPAAGTYVALTLQGPPPSAASQPLEPLSNDQAPNQRASVAGEAPPSPPPPASSAMGSIPSQRITRPKPLQVTSIAPKYYHHYYMTLLPFHQSSLNGTTVLRSG